jgi:hypothetical protein
MALGNAPEQHSFPPSRPFWNSGSVVASLIKTRSPRKTGCGQVEVSDTRYFTIGS